MTEPLTFGGWLRRRRKAHDLTQEQLAELVGCSEETIRKIEAGGRRPSKPMAELMAEHLGIPAEDRLAVIHFARTGNPGLPVPGDSMAPMTPLNTGAFLPTERTSFVGREKERGQAR